MAHPIAEMQKEVERGARTRTGSVAEAQLEPKLLPPYHSDSSFGLGIFSM